MKNNKNNNRSFSQMRKKNRNQNILQLCLIVVFIIGLNLLSSLEFFRIDLTKDKRFSLSDYSKEIVENLDDEVYIEIYLKDDNLPADLVRYQRTIDDFMRNICSYSDKIKYVFKNPFTEGINKEQTFLQKWFGFSEGEDISASDKMKICKQLYDKGLDPTYVRQEENMGGSEKIIFGGALVKYREKDFPVNLLPTVNGKYQIMSPPEVENEFIHALWALTDSKIQKVAFLEGHNELDESLTYDIMKSLSKYYRIERVNMNGSLSALDEYACVVVAKPQSWFSESDKYIIDQYIMKGGKMIWLTEWMKFDMDSLSYSPSSMALINDVNLSDQLFNYGVRINPDLIQDIRCLSIPVNVNTIDGRQQFEPKPWYYFPLIVPDTLLDHPLVKNVDVMRTCFVSSIDTVGEDPNVKKTILLRTSQYAKALTHPVEVSLNILREKPERQTFNKPNMAVAVLLEGKFKSAFANRLAPELANDKDFDFKDRSVDTKMIVISDGDFVRNEVKRYGDKIQPYPLGSDKYFETQFTPGNTQFILNCVNYLCADEDLISLRRVEKIRLLKAEEVKQDKIKWICINTIIPILLVLCIGLTMIILRRVKYSNKQGLQNNVSTDPHKAKNFDSKKKQTPKP